MFVGHEKQIEYFNKVLRSGKLSHAYFFHGPEHVGKFTFAKEIVKSLLCSNMHFSSDRDKSAYLDGACQACDKCISIAKDINSRVIILDTEHTLVSKKETRKDILIEDIRELKRILAFANAPGEWRVVIINEAEKMNAEAGNAFLKLLEEPGSGNIFFLITSAPELVPQTIRSRAVPIRFSTPHQSLTDGFLKERVGDAALRSIISTLSFGKPGMMVKFLEDPALLEREKRYVAALGAVSRGSLGEVFRFAEKSAEDRDLLRRGVEYLFLLLRRELHAAQSIAEAKHIAQKLKRVHETALVLETTNVNPRLAFDVMLLEAKSM